MKRIITGLFVMLFLALFSYAQAGSLMVGVKTWAALWDSGTLNQYEKVFEKTPDVTEVSITKNPGYGFLAGPAAGYTTDDGKWSFGAAFLALGRFRQTMITRDLNNGTDYEASSFDVRYKRMDFDASVNYIVTNWFKVFAGYKFQKYKTEADFVFSNGTARFEGTVEYDALVHMPAAGVGLSWPVNERLALGLQMGAMYVIPAYVDFTSKSGGATDMDERLYTRNSFGFNGEAAATFMVSGGVIAQLGYRVQIFEFNATPSTVSGQTKGTDLTHGIVISAFMLL